MAASTIIKRILLLLVLLPFSGNVAHAQDTDEAKVELGSRTAKNGFRNEDEIRDKFNQWSSDADARAWLLAMNHKLAGIKSVTAIKPYGQKADVEVTVRRKSGERVERISIKLVSSANGFNQIDKRWVEAYAKMWKMPPDIVAALKLFVGQTPPQKLSRRPERMYLNEMSDRTQRKVIDFFSTNKDEIVSDLIAGDGDHAADWFMVTFKGAAEPKWLIRSLKDTIKYFGQGDVVMTRAGNLKIGRVSMQRKGGDNGRETAKMLQFKINPVQLFDAK